MLKCGVMENTEHWADFPGGTVHKLFPFWTSFAHVIPPSVKSPGKDWRIGRMSPSQENDSLLRAFSAERHSHLNAHMSQRPTNSTNIHQDNIQAFPFLPPQHPGYALACSLLQQS